MLIRVLVAARAPESDIISEFVVVIFEFIRPIDSERVTKLLLCFVILLDSIFILVSSVARRPNIVLKILEKASCILDKRGAELNSVIID